MVAIGLGWYAVAAVTEPAFLWYTVVDNHVLNVARMREFPDEDVPLSALEFLAAAGFGAFPWILAALVAVGALVRARAWRDPAELPWVALAVWAVGVLALFTVSPFKLPHYGLPAYPALALLAARAWRDVAPRPRRLIAAHLALFLLAGAGCAWAAAGDGQAFTEAVFGVSDVYSRKEAALGQASPYPAWSSLQPLVAWAAVVLLAGAAVLAAAAARRSARVGAWTVAGVMLLLVPTVATGLAVTSSARAVTVMAAEIRARLGPGDLLVLEGPIENAGAVEFYSGHRPALLDAERSVLGIGATFADAAGTFWSAPRFAEAWASPRPPYPADHARARAERRGLAPPAERPPALRPQRPLALRPRPRGHGSGLALMLTNLIIQFSYPGVFLVLLATGLGLPIPEELPIVIAAMMSRWQVMHWWGALLSCLGGVLAGDMLLYWVGRHFGRRILEWPSARRILTPEREARVMDAYHRHGLKFVIMARLVMGLRAAAFLTAGLVRVPFPRFLLVDVAAVLLSVPLAFGLAYAVADSVAVALAYVHEMQLWIGGAVLFIAAVWLLVWCGGAGVGASRRARAGRCDIVSPS